MTDRKKILVATIYSHPEYYPPTLNALNILAEQYDAIYFLHRNITGFNWQYPTNVFLVKPGKLLDLKTVEKAGIIRKIYWFLRFSFCFLRLIIKKRPHTILLYDTMPVLAFRIIYPFIKTPVISWYHNHDVCDEIYTKKFSLTWFAWKSEKWLFPKLNMFSLPAIERKQFFPMDKLRKGTFFFIPNYPSKKLYLNNEAVSKSLELTCKLLYQGSIGKMHGLEEIIQILHQPVQKKKLLLVLKGFIVPDYKNELIELAAQAGVSEQLSFIPPTGYAEVIENAKSCHIGIGIHKKQDKMNTTLGTASNKIYEYAASGMPVLVYDNAHFVQTLKNKEWVFFTTAAPEDLKIKIEKILANYTYFSNIALQDFQTELCFENYFSEVTLFLKQF